MKTLLSLFSTLYFFSSQAQITECSSIPLSYDRENVAFTVAVPQSFGDSMIVFNITNNHPSQYFAYPVAKLVPLTPLPTGMELTSGSAGWNVFASSWNPAATMPVGIYYSVTSPIPLNYIVEFELWVSNLTPLLSDSCSFDSTFTINLNPGLANINHLNASEEWIINYNSDERYLQVTSKSGKQKPVTLALLDVSGKIINSGLNNIDMNGIRIDVSTFKAGIYILHIEGRDSFLSQKVIIY